MIDETLNTIVASSGVLEEARTRTYIQSLGHPSVSGAGQVTSH